MRKNELISFTRIHLVSTNFPSEIQVQPTPPEYPVDSKLFERLSPEARAKYKQSPARQKVKAKPTRNKTVRLKKEITFPDSNQKPSTSNNTPYNPAFDDEFSEVFFALPPKNNVIGVYEKDNSVGVRYWDRDNPNLNGENLSKKDTFFFKEYLKDKKNKKK